ncbi:MAG: S9 family peptidase [Alphaproteobacteria bacterium]|nr:S9 family peptidase [Alphaproteobacteria bacterium]
MRLSSLLAGAASLAVLTNCTSQETTPRAPVNVDTPPPVTEAEDTSVTVTPPIAKREPVTIEQVGRTRVDAYQWLKDENWQQVMRDPSVLRADIREYLEAENAYTKAQLEEPLEALKTELFEEMRGRIKEDDSSLPDIDGPYAYLSKYREGGEYPIFARRPATDIYAEDATDEILLDGDVLGKDKAYFSFGALGHSPDHKLVAYAYDDQGSEYYTIKFRDTATGEDLPDEVTGTAGNFTWSENSDAIYWVERDDNGRSVAVHHYKIGAEGSTEIYRERDPGFFTGVGKSQSGKYIFISVGDQVTTETWAFPADATDPAPTVIAPRETGVEYNVEHWDDKFIITTNDGGAVDFKIVTAPIDAPGKENWTELVAHQPGALILGIDVLKDYMVRTVRVDGLPRAVIRERTSGTESEIAFEEAAYDLSTGTGYEYDTDLIRLDYSSPTTPEQVFDYNLKTGERVLRKEQEVPSGHNPSDYVAERIMAEARDGETVPVTILRHKDTPVDGSAPMLLYGYGSYGITVSARFRTTPLALADRGMIYAIVHPRGSMAKGYQWYLDGKLKKKVNTFNDYVDAGNYLVEQGYSTRGKVVGMGGSAGGLLMGAAVNQDPELFGGIIAAVPFVDVINTMSDESLPLTPPEWPEWGNPITSGEDYDTMMAYSPYDQVSDQAYPAMLITGGLSDPRVTYWEPSKWAAKLRHDAPNGGPYFLRINMEAGHGGASGRFEGLKETALEFAFALDTVGLAERTD